MKAAACLIFPCLVILAGTPCLAATNNAATLSKLQQQLAQKQASQQRLAGQVKDADAALEQTQDQMVATAQSVRDSEQNLQKLEAQIATSIDAEAAQQKELSADTASMGDLVLALTRLRRVPPALLLARPGAPLQTAETATLLGSILPNLNQRTTAIAVNIKQLQVTQAMLAADRQKEIAARATLDQKYKQVATLAAQRKALYQNLSGDLSQTQADVGKISQQAQSVQDLIDRLAKARAAAKEEKAASVPATPGETSGPTHYAYSWSMPRPGRPELPVAGRIVTGYAERDRIGALSQGITLAANPGALVVAPMGGVVRYAGPFKNYGHLMLLEHDQGYISLIAGLDTMDAAIGQSLQAGEPLGKLPGASSRAAAPALYYELRYHGQPVNPAAKFPDLKVKS